MNDLDVRKRAVVFGYHNVGVRCLKVLLAAGVDVALVVTHEDSASENIWFESVISLCQSEGIPYVTPADARSPELLARVQAARPDLMFSFYYRHMLPAELLAVAPAFNMHGSLLPEFRGRGLDSVLYHWVWTKAAQHGIYWGEGGWILEDNPAMNLGLSKMGFTVYKTLRMYDRPL